MRAYLPTKKIFRFHLKRVRLQDVAAAMQGGDGRIPLHQAIQILSFKKANSKKDLDRISRILDPGLVGSIAPSQLVRAACSKTAAVCLIHYRYRT